MLVGHGAKPEAKIEGNAMDSRLIIGKQSVRFDKDTGRIVND
jgi:hypothetical protein